ncbi:MAG: CHAD domain-containing protein [Myxococcota bacterium]
MEAAKSGSTKLNSEAPAHHWRRVVEDKVKRLYERARGPQADEETWVHDVRVATRRLEEALELARPVLPPVEDVKRRVRTLRRALGEARELDVLVGELLALEALASWPESERTAFLQKVTAHRDGLMARAQSKLLPKLSRHQKKAMGLASKGPSLPFLVRDLGATHLYARCERVVARLPSLDQPEAARDHHRLRVDIKRLRYTLEMLGPLLATDLSPLKAHQERLGAFNDAWDLLDFVRGRLVRRSLGPFCEPVEAEIEGRIQERFEQAREAAQEDLPHRLTALRQSAGRLGKIELRRT